MVLSIIGMIWVNHMISYESKFWWWKCLKDVSITFMKQMNLDEIIFYQNIVNLRIKINQRIVSQ